MIELLQRMSKPEFFLKRELDNMHSLINRDYMLNMSTHGSETELFCVNIHLTIKSSMYSQKSGLVCSLLSHPYRLSKNYESQKWDVQCSLVGLQSNIL